MDYILPASYMKSILHYLLKHSELSHALKLCEDITNDTLPEKREHGQNTVKCKYSFDTVAALNIALSFYNREIQRFKDEKMNWEVLNSLINTMELIFNMHETDPQLVFPVVATCLKLLVLGGKICRNNIGNEKVINDEDFDFLVRLIEIVESLPKWAEKQNQLPLQTQKRLQTLVFKVENFRLSCIKLLMRKQNILSDEQKEGNNSNLCDPYSY